MMTSAARRCCCDGPQGAKELIHIKAWLARVDESTQRGKEAYLADALLQEAGDSLMMKLGEAANRLSRRAGARRSRVGPRGCNRNFIICQYDQINHKLTWLTLPRDLPAWTSSLRMLFAEAATTIEDDSD